MIMIISRKLGYKFTKSQEKVDYLMHMDDIQLFAKKEKELENLMQTIRIYSQKIGMECAMLIMRSGKRQITKRV